MLWGLTNQECYSRKRRTFCIISILASGRPAIEVRSLQRWHIKLARERRRDCQLHQQYKAFFALDDNLTTTTITTMLPRNTLLVCEVEDSPNGGSGSCFCITKRGTPCKNSTKSKTPRRPSKVDLSLAREFRLVKFAIQALCYC